MRLLGSEKLSYEVPDLEPETPAAGSQAQPPSAGGSEGRQPEADTRPPSETQEAKVARALAASRSPIRRLERLRESFRCSPTLTRQEVVQILGVSDVTATHDLAALIAEGFIEKVRPTASPRTHYFRLRPPPPQAT